LFVGALFTIGTILCAISCSDSDPCDDLEAELASNEWRCDNGSLEATKARIASGTSDCPGYWVYDCLGPTPPPGTFGCGPLDCALGETCKISSLCGDGLGFVCEKAKSPSPCTGSNCTCAELSDGVECGSQQVKSCDFGPKGNVYVSCANLESCGSS